MTRQLTWKLNGSGGIKTVQLCRGHGTINGFSVAIKALVWERAFAYEAECQVGYCWNISSLSDDKIQLLGRKGQNTIKFEWSHSAITQHAWRIGARSLLSSERLTAVGYSDQKFEVSIIIFFQRKKGTH